MGARSTWLLGVRRGTGKATSSVVVFFEGKANLVGDQCRGHWLPCEAYDFDRDRR